MNCYLREARCDCASSPLPKFDGHVLCRFDSIKDLIRDGSLHPNREKLQERVSAFSSRTRVAPSNDWVAHKLREGLERGLSAALATSAPRSPTQNQNQSHPRTHPKPKSPALCSLKYDVAACLPLFAAVCFFAQNCVANQFTVDDLDIGSELFASLAVGALDKDRSGAFLC